MHQPHKLILAVRATSVLLFSLGNGILHRIILYFIFQNVI